MTRTLRRKFLLLQSGTPFQDLVVLISVSFIGDLLPATMKCDYTQLELTEKF